MNGASASTRRRQNQHQTEYAQKDRQREEPSFAGVAAPQATREIADRSRRAPEHDPSPADGAGLSDHAASSFSDFTRADPRFVTTIGAATSVSMPQRRNVEYPSSARHTIGSPATLNDVFSRIGMPLRRPYASSRAYKRGAISRSSTCTRADPSTCVTAPS